MAISDTITSMYNNTSNAYDMLSNGTDLTGINKNLENLSSTIFEAFLEALRTPDTLFTNLPKTSASGSNITLNNTAYAPMRITLNPTALSQTTYTGKNKIDLENPTSMISATYDSTTKIYTSNTLTSNYAGISMKNTGTTLNVSSGDIIYFSADVRLKSGTYTSALNKIIDTTSITSTSQTITNPNLSSSFQRYVFKITYSTSGTIEGCLIQLRTGLTNVVLEAQNIMISTSSDTTYEPYVGGTASPNPSYPQDIHTINGNNSVLVRGANLFNKDTITTNTGWLIEDGTISQNHPDYYVSDYILVSPNTDYYRTKTGSTRAKYYDKNKQPLNTTSYQDISILGNAGTFTTPANCYYIRMTMKTENIDTLMLNLGTTATTYTPYVSQTAPINLDTIEYCKIGNYADRIFKNVSGDPDYSSERDNGAWYIKKNIGKVMLDGSESWSTRAFPDSSYLSLKLTLANGGNNCLCDRFVYNSNYDIAEEHFLVSNQWQELSFAILKSRLGSADTTGWKNWLSSNNTIVYYILATPTYTKITGTLETQLEQVYKGMLSYDGVTNISQINNDLSFIINASGILG